MVLMLSQTLQDLFGTKESPYFYRTILIGMEGLIIHVQRNGRFDDTDKKQVKRAFLRLLDRALSPENKD